jgi:hypothetical protein
MMARRGIDVCLSVSVRLRMSTCVYVCLCLCASEHLRLCRSSGLVSLLASTMTVTGARLATRQIPLG